MIATIKVNPSIMDRPLEEREALIKGAAFHDLGLRRPIPYSAATIVACEDAGDGWFTAIVDVDTGQQQTSTEPTEERP